MDQVKQPAGRAHNDVNALLQFFNVRGNLCPSDAGTTFDIHILSNLEDHLLCLLYQFSSRREDKRLSRVDRQIQLKVWVDNIYILQLSCEVGEGTNEIITSRPFGGCR